MIPNDLLVIPPALKENRSGTIVVPEDVDSLVEDMSNGGSVDGNGAETDAVEQTNAPVGAAAEQDELNPYIDAIIVFFALLGRLMRELAARVLGAFHAFIAWVFAVGRVVVLVMAVMYLLNSKKSSFASPKNDLQDFVLVQQEKGVSEVASFHDLKTDKFEEYAAAICVEGGASLEATRKALAGGLEGVPQSVQQDVVKRALAEGITAKNMWKNSNADLVDSSKAHSYMGYFSTAYDSGSDEYKTCVTVTGLTFSVAETVAGYTETEEVYKAGTKLDCTGAFFRCWEVPYFATRVVKTPHFKRSVLSLEQQKGLHSWMIHRAIESASYLVTYSDNVGRDKRLPSGDAKGWDWSPPAYVDEL
ncbi:expressed unknown protein [Seminavis robusta]|uniref:Uncharacterized protein n=1 Tax=Seminavis robusta TaxID=568900 RepID=A0A9N8HLY0_9STRA|nr:expressed unknown protein [Seminavis robusta]|eukprot:Sro952_g224130.1 n/a (361) ;mRNA; r:38547-39629